MKNGITSKGFWIGPYPYANETRLACKNSTDWDLSFMSLLRGITGLGLGKYNCFTKHIDHTEIDFIIARNEKSQMYAVLQKRNRAQDRPFRWWMLNALVCLALTLPEWQTGLQLRVPEMCNGRSGRLKESGPSWGTESLDPYP